MTASSLSTIAQLLCDQSLPMNFAKLIGEVDKLLEQLVEAPFRVTWDCDQAVSFDQPGSRILLVWTEHPGHGLSGVLTLSVGPSPMLGKRVMRPDHEAVARRLAGHLAQRTRAQSVLWQRMACEMSPEWVDLLIEALPDPAEAKATAARSPAKPKTTAAPTLRLMSQEIQRRLPTLPPAQTTHRPEDRSTPIDADLQRLRAALYEDDAEDAPPCPSAQMRLAVHAMNATLIMVWLPLGAAALVHGLVRGEDMRLASRLMVLTGSIGALAQSPLGQQAASLLHI